MERREQMNDNAVKVDCLEATLESIRIREDKLLSRGEMLQDFLSDLLDQSENLTLEAERNAEKVQRRLGNLEERLLLNEIQAQHLTLGVFAVEEEVETMAEEEYNKELDSIILDGPERQERNYYQVEEDFANQQEERRRRKKKSNSSSNYQGLDEILDRAAKQERMRRRQVLDDSDVSTAMDDSRYDESLVALDGYNSSPDTELTSERAMGGSYNSRRSRKQHEYHRHERNERDGHGRRRQHNHQNLRRLSSFGSSSSRSHSQPQQSTNEQPFSPTTTGRFTSCYETIYRETYHYTGQDSQQH